MSEASKNHRRTRESKFFQQLCVDWQAAAQTEWTERRKILERDSDYKTMLADPEWQKLAEEWEKSGRRFEGNGNSIERMAMLATDYGLPKPEPETKKLKALRAQGRAAAKEYEKRELDKRGLKPAVDANGKAEPIELPRHGFKILRILGNATSSFTQEEIEKQLETTEVQLCLRTIGDCLRKLRKLGLTRQTGRGKSGEVITDEGREVVCRLSTKIAG